MILALLAALQLTPPPAPASCALGFQLTESDGTSRAIAEKQTDHRKLGNVIGASFFGGLIAGPMTVKTVLNGPTADVRTKDSRPEFLFCAEVPQTTDSSDASSGMGYVGMSAAAGSPREFRLIRFEVTDRQREVVLSAAGVFTDQGKAVKKTVVRFDVEDLGNGRYRVKPMQELEPGEYGFLRTAGNTTAANSKKAAPERVFDFAVE